MTCKGPRNLVTCFSFSSTQFVPYHLMSPSLPFHLPTAEMVGGVWLPPLPSSPTSASGWRSSRAGVSNLSASFGHIGRIVLGLTNINDSWWAKKCLCIISVIPTTTDKQKSPHIQKAGHGCSRWKLLMPRGEMRDFTYKSGLQVYSHTLLNVLPHSFFPFFPLLDEICEVAASLGPCLTTSCQGWRAPYLGQCGFRPKFQGPPDRPSSQPCRAHIRLLTRFRAISKPHTVSDSRPHLHGVNTSSWMTHVVWPSDQRHCLSFSWTYSPSHLLFPNQAEFFEHLLQAKHFAGCRDKR